MRSIATTTLLLFCCLTSAAANDRLDMQAVNDAQPAAHSPPKTKISPVIVKAQILLDRARFSPGEIDGKPGENFTKALTAFEQQNGLPTSAQLSDDVWKALASPDSSPVRVTYTVTD